MTRTRLRLVGACLLAASAAAVAGEPLLWDDVALVNGATVGPNKVLVCPPKQSLDVVRSGEDTVYRCVTVRVVGGNIVHGEAVPTDLQGALDIQLGGAGRAVAVGPIPRFGTLIGPVGFYVAFRYIEKK